MNDFLNTPNFTLLSPACGLPFPSHRAMYRHFQSLGWTLRALADHIGILNQDYRSLHWLTLKRALLGESWSHDPVLLKLALSVGYRTPELAADDFPLRAKLAMVSRGTNVTEVAAAIGRSRVVTSQAINHGLHEPTRKLIAQHLGIAA